MNLDRLEVIKFTFLLSANRIFRTNLSTMFSQASKYAIKSVIYVWTKSLEDRKVGKKKSELKLTLPRPLPQRFCSLWSKPKSSDQAKVPMAVSLLMNPTLK